MMSSVTKGPGWNYIYVVVLDTPDAVICPLTDYSVKPFVEHRPRMLGYVLLWIWREEGECCPLLLVLFQVTVQTGQFFSLSVAV